MLEALPASCSNPAARHSGPRRMLWRGMTLAAPGLLPKLSLPAASWLHGGDVWLRVGAAPRWTANSRQLAPWPGWRLVAEDKFRRAG
jgi:hypothetical protein